MRKLSVLPIVTALLLVASATAQAQGTVPAGSAIRVTLNESVSSKTAQAGQKISGNVTSDVVVNGRTVIPKDSRVTLLVASARPSGRLKTPAKLYLRINSIEVRGKTYEASSDLAGQTGRSHKKRNIEAIGGTAAAGAIIGAIAGGGKGAGIGAASGAAVGTAGAALTGKKDIVYPAETKLRFTLRTPLTIK